MTFFKTLPLAILLAIPFSTSTTFAAAGGEEIPPIDMACFLAPKPKDPVELELPNLSQEQKDLATAFLFERVPQPYDDDRDAKLQEFLSKIDSITYEGAPKEDNLYPDDSFQLTINLKAPFNPELKGKPHLREKLNKNVNLNKQKIEIQSTLYCGIDRFMDLIAILNRHKDRLPITVNPEDEVQNESNEGAAAANLACEAKSEAPKEMLENINLNPDLFFPSCNQFILHPKKGDTPSYLSVKTTWQGQEGWFEIRDPEILRLFTEWGKEKIPAVLDFF